jgi:hypothetical protein
VGESLRSNECPKRWSNLSFIPNNRDTVVNRSGLPSFTDENNLIESQRRKSGSSCRLGYQDASQTGF